MTPETPVEVGAVRATHHASTEPGPDDPGDLVGREGPHGEVCRLQRSRGRMTPETSDERFDVLRADQGASTEPGPDDPGDAVG